MKQTKNRPGFTLFELIIVLSILVILLAAGVTNWKGQITRAYDARRKGDLAKIKAALEHYANDHGCYPLESEMTCGSTVFSAYNMARLVCDPEGNASYWYEPVDTTDLCAGYRLYTHILTPKDNDVQTLGCDGSNGCGVAGHPELNYGVSSGVPVLQ